MILQPYLLRLELQLHCFQHTNFFFILKKKMSMKDIGK